MPQRLKSSTSEAPLAPIASDILDQFVRQAPLTPEELDAVVRRFKKAIIERAPGGEMTHHLGYARGEDRPEDSTHHRNGASGKTVLTDDGPLALEVARDRAGTLSRARSGSASLHGFRRQGIAPYARGLTAARFRRVAVKCTASRFRRI